MTTPTLPRAGTTTCEHDSGSMTGCQPLCSRPATVAVRYRNGSYACTALVCSDHVTTTANRAYPSVAVATDLPR